MTTTRARFDGYRAELVPRTPFFREGWALYWELLLYERGFNDTPAERIGAMFWLMHRCARIVFSLRFHLGDWSPQEAIDFLVDRVGHERENATAEVRRSFEGTTAPLYQAAYLLGGLQLLSLLARAGRLRGITATRLSRRGASAELDADRAPSPGGQPGVAHAGDAARLALLRQSQVTAALSVHAIGIAGLVLIFIVGTVRPINLGVLAHRHDVSRRHVRRPRGAARDVLGLSGRPVRAARRASRTCSASPPGTAPWRGSSTSRSARRGAGAR